MRLAREIWSILTPSQRRRVLAAQSISLVMALATVVGITSIAPFFAVLGNPRLIEQHRLLHWLYASGGFHAAGAFEAALGAGFIALVALADAVSAAGLLALTRLALGIGNQLQAALFEEYLGRPYLFHAQVSGATLAHNVIYEVGRLNSGLLQNGFVLNTQAATASLIVLSAAILDPAAALALALFLLGGYFLIYLRMRKSLLHLGEIHTGAWLERARIAAESFGAIKEILLLRDRDMFLQRFARASRQAARTAAVVQVAAQIPKHVMECVGVTVLVATALLLRGRDGGMSGSLGQLTFIAFAAYRLLPMLQQIFAAVVKIRAERPGFDLIAPDLRRARQAAASPLPRAPTDPGHWWRDRPRREITLEGVSFRYAADRPQALTDIGMRIPAGTMIGIAGRNGSGKSTLMDIIAGLLSPTAGTVKIDGVLLDERNVRQWQERIAYVPQHAALLDASIADNIAFGEPSGRIDRRRMIAAARAARLEELIGDLPHHYEHRIGEGGVSLSGGQRQRIGIARALYRQATVLLLDEATSALDRVTEAELMHTLAALRGSCTIVVVTHRLPALQACDRVLDLDDGRPSGDGSDARKHSRPRASV